MVQNGDKTDRKNICRAVEASKLATNPINFVEGKGPKPKANKGAWKLKLH